MRLLPAIFLVLMCHVGFAFDNAERSAVRQRIKPIGQLRLEADTQTKTQTKVSATDEKVSSDEAEVARQQAVPLGEKIYQQYCVTCHRAGLAGAPRFRESADWASRLSSKSLDELTQTAIKGINAMPPKGTCVSCSDEDIKAAVEYMLPK